MNIGTPPLSITNNADARAVRVLQDLLNQNGANLYPDGRFALGTQRALSDFQESNGLDPTGIADEATWAKLAPTQDKPAKKAPAKKAPAKKATAKKAPAKKAPAKKKK